MTTFSQISRCISETVIDRWAHAARQFVSIEEKRREHNLFVHSGKSEAEVTNNRRLRST